MAEDNPAIDLVSWPRQEAEILTRYAVLAYEDQVTIKDEIKSDGVTDFIWLESIRAHGDTQASRPRVLLFPTTRRSRAESPGSSP